MSREQRASRDVALDEHRGICFRQFSGGHTDDEIVEGVRGSGDSDVIETEKRLRARQRRCRYAPSNVASTMPIAD